MSNKCLRCNRELKSPRARYGPVCAKIMGVDEEYYRANNRLVKNNSFLQRQKQRKLAKEIEEARIFEWLREKYPNLSVSKLDDISKKYNNTPWYLWVANLIGTTLNMPQSLYLNALNAVTSMMKGEQITYHNNMSYRDYQREQTRKFGGKSMADFTDEMRTKGLAGNVAGNMIDFALELATDPGFMSFAAKTIQKSAARTAKVPSIRHSEGATIKFGSDVKSATKLSNQMAQRGWSENTVMDTVSSPYTTRTSTNMATGNSATAYYNKTGGYVIIDDVSKAVVQVSDNINPSSWIPDPNIINPYKP